MSDDMNLYPRGYIAMLNGDLMDVTNVKITQKNAAKLVHTLRKEGAGIVKGNEETDVSFDAVCPQQGAERDYFDDVRKGKIRKLRVKIPGETFTVIGMYTDRDLDLPLDDAVKYSLKFIGRTEK